MGLTLLAQVPERLVTGLVGNGLDIVVIGVYPPLHELLVRLILVHCVKPYELPAV